LASPTPSEQTYVSFGSMSTGSDYGSCGRTSPGARSGSSVAVSSEYVDPVKVRNATIVSNMETTIQEARDRAVLKDSPVVDEYARDVESAKSSAKTFIKKHKKVLIVLVVLAIALLCLTGYGAAILAGAHLVILGAHLIPASTALFGSSLAAEIGSLSAVSAVTLASFIGGVVTSVVAHKARMKKNRCEIQLKKLNSPLNPGRVDQFIRILEQFSIDKTVNRHPLMLAQTYMTGELKDHKGKGSGIIFFISSMHGFIVSL